MAKKREAQDELPRAWAAMLLEPEAKLVAILSERVSSACGVKPDAETVAGFLKRLTARSFEAPLPARVPLPPVGRNAEKMQRSRRGPDGPFGYVLFGAEGSASSARAVLTEVLEVLDERFPGRLLHIRPGRKRQYIAAKRSEVYPGRPDLYDDDAHVKRLKSGLWVGVNVSRSSMKDVLQRACEAVGISFGRDLRLKF